MKLFYARSLRAPRGAVSAPRTEAASGRLQNWTAPVTNQRYDWTSGPPLPATACQREKPPKAD